MKIRLIIWGIGKVYNTMVNLLRCYVGITAQELPNYRTIDGFHFVKIETLQKLDYDYLMIMSEKYFQEIVDTAMHLADVPRTKIISYHLLEIPHFNFSQYDLIRKTNISIVSNNCWGGVIYHTLGMECRSPFKNVSFSSNDYIKIIGDLKHYLSVDPVWTGKKEMDTNQNREVPMLELDDVLIKCNHDLDVGKAIQNWKRRRDKFNWNNILIEMYTEDPEVEEAFGKVTEQFHKRICFVSYESDKQFSMKLPRMEGQTKFYETVNANAGIGKNAIAYNIIAAMNGRKEYRII